ncbi:MAG: DsbA family protein [Aestuariivirga sp.]
MNGLNRRSFILGSTALAGLAIPALAVDTAELNKPPAIGEMAMGPADAKVVLIEYASASCPHCAAFYNDTFGALKKEYIDTNKIRFVFREFPHNDAALAAFMLVRSVPKDAYFPMIDIFFKTQAKWVPNWPEELFNIAKQAGFTKETFDKTLKDKALAQSIIDVRDTASKFGVTGVPTFFLNGERLDGEVTIETLRAKIDPLLG